MFTKVKTEQEINNMRIGGKICAEILAKLCREVKPGMSTKNLADMAAAELKQRGVTASFLNYNGFPEVICISVNDEVVHGIPHDMYTVKSGDIVSFDFGVTYKDMIVDCARSVLVDSDDPVKTKLLAVTKESLAAGVAQLKNNCYTGSIGNAVEQVLANESYGIVRDLVGHGVGHYVHEEPNIPNYGKRNAGHKLKAGMTVAIEPMATLGEDAVYVDSDKWTVKTVDGSNSAHFEQTVLITNNSYEILTPFID